MLLRMFALEIILFEGPNASFPVGGRRKAQVAGSACLIHLEAGEGCEQSPGWGTPSSEDFNLFSPEPQGAINLDFWSVKGRQADVTPGLSVAKWGSTPLCPIPLLSPRPSGFPTWLRTRTLGSSASEAASGLCSALLCWCFDVPSSLHPHTVIHMYNLYTHI